MANLPAVLQLQQQLLKRLSAWSILSIAVGGVLLLTTPARSFWGGFGGMTAVWGIINLLIATVGLYGLWRKIHKGIEDEQREQRYLRRLLLVNTYLDIGYVLVGIGLAGWAPAGWLKGFGWGVIIQGGFLLFFDAWYYRQGGKL